MSNIQQELKLCREYAENGYNIANDSLNEMKSALNEEKEKLRSADRHQQSNRRMENDRHFQNQLRDMDNLEREVINEVDGNLKNLKSQMEDFTIVLYGRTMAGKSTLMEILRHGDGSSIGKGAQRTTLDVRAYKWNGLKIFDVPGTCSFGGSEDDNLALKAAKTADLALFLLTDDAPQPSEADRLAELKALGKPVLGIVNVKQSLDTNPSSANRKLNLRQIEKRINDPTRLQEIVRQFKEFAKKGDNMRFKGGYNFDDIPFVYSHLQSAFFSQREKDSALYKLSNFETVENFILDKVSNDGKFIRIKTFADAVALPMQKAIAKLYGHSADSVKTWRSYNEKIKQLDEWYDRFFKSTQNRYDNFIDDLESKINSKMNYVVNNYYESSRAGEVWKEQLDSLNINRECQNFIRKIGEEATRKMRELSDELVQDLRYSGVSVGGSDIRMPEIDDVQGGLMMAAPLLALTPVGWAGAAVLGIGAWLFGDSKEEKIRQAKRDLREKLEPSRDELLSKIGDSVINILNKEILNKQIGGFRNTLIDMCNTLKNLAFAQNKVANTINIQYDNLNVVLFMIASDYVGIDYKSFGEISVTRIVGEEFLIESEKKPFEFSRHKLSNLIGENIRLYSFANFIERINQQFLDGQLDSFTWIDDERGRMYIIFLPQYIKQDQKAVQIIQQAMCSPVII